MLQNHVLHILGRRSTEQYFEINGPTQKIDPPSNHVPDRWPIVIANYYFMDLLYFIHRLFFTPEVT